MTFTAKKRWWVRMLLVCAVLLIMAAVMIWNMPAAIAYRWYQNRLGAVNLTQLSGLLWAGSAQQTSFAGVPLGKMEWRLDRKGLFTGNWQGDLDLRGEWANARLNFLAGKGRFNVQASEASFPAALLAGVLDVPALIPTGTISMQIDNFEFTKGQLVAANGVARWLDMGAVGASAAKLPGVEIKFSSHALQVGSIDATIIDLGGPLSINGEFALRQRVYQAEIRLQLREANPQIAELLKYIGERTADGTSILRLQGELKALE